MAHNENWHADGWDTGHRHAPSWPADASGERSGIPSQSATPWPRRAEDLPLDPDTSTPGVPGDPGRDGDHYGTRTWVSAAPGSRDGTGVGSASGFGPPVETRAGVARGEGSTGETRIGRRRAAGGGWWSRVPWPGTWPARVAAGTGVVVLAAVVGVAVMLQSTGAPACAAPVVDAVPTGTGSHSGIATYYTGLGQGGNYGNCSFRSAPADNFYVALSPSEYAAAGACGGYLDVTGRKGTVRVKVVDQCPECAVGHLDLSKQAFAAVDDLVKGQVSITYKGVVDPPLAGAMSVVVKDGSSQYWIGFLIDNHGDPLSTVEVKSGSAWKALARKDYNYWLAESGAGKGPFTLRITDVYGHQATASGITLSPLTVQKTSARLYGAGTPVSSPTPRASSAATSTSPSASPAAVDSPSPSAAGSMAGTDAAVNAATVRCHG